MPAKRLLRILILVEIPVMVAIGVATYLSVPSLPDPLRNFLSVKDQISPDSTVIEVVALVAFLIANVGLYVFWSGARTFYFVVTLALQLSNLLLGPFVATGWTELFEATLTLLNGVILGVIYFSPIRDLFGRQEAGNKSVDATIEPPASSPGFAAPCAPIEVVAVPPPRVATPQPAAGGSHPNPGKAAPFCGACGAPSQGGKFCPECGAPLVVKNQCPRCGAVEEPGKKFCRECGGPML